MIQKPKKVKNDSMAVLEYIFIAQKFWRIKNNQLGRWNLELYHKCTAEAIYSKNLYGYNNYVK